MDYLMYMEQIKRRCSEDGQVQFLVSGNDNVAENAVVREVVNNCRKKADLLFIVDDTDFNVNMDCIVRAGYHIVNGLSGEYSLYNPFHISSIKDVSKIRQMLDTLGYDEKQKGKLIAYLNFIRHLEILRNGSTDVELTIEKLCNYCTTIAVEECLIELVESGIIEREQQDLLLRKYSECASAGADLEDVFFMVMPYINGQEDNLCQNDGTAIILKTGELGEDDVARTLILQLLQFSLERQSGKNVTVLVFDKGYGSRKCLFSFVKSLSTRIQIHLFSRDIFTLTDTPSLAMIMNRFPIRVYSRHSVMNSAEYIEKICGDVDVPKYQKTTTYDRRWRANSPWDILMGKNKTESYTEMATVREPLYRKEMIMNMSSGEAIVQYMGNTSILSF